MSGHRPHFDRPPLIEVVCGVQFEGLESWGTPHYGRFWSRIESEYPDFEEHPPLAQVRLPPSVPTDIHPSPVPPLRRVFFIQPPGNFLIQVQQNRFLHNWRKVKDDDEYPRYGAAYDRFQRSWGEFQEFLKEAKLPTPRPDVFELTYINHITAEGACFPRDVWNFLGFYERSPEVTTAMEATGMMMHFAWRLSEDRGVLTMDVKHGRRITDGKEVLQMELTARGKGPDGTENMEVWFNVAHEAIVSTFERLTTEQAHRLWGKHK